MSSPLGEEEFEAVMDVDSLPLEPTERESPASTVLDTPASCLQDPTTLDTLPADLPDLDMPPLPAPNRTPKNESLDELDKRILELQQLECRVCVGGLGMFVCVYVCVWVGGKVGRWVCTHMVDNFVFFFHDFIACFHGNPKYPPKVVIDMGLSITILYLN